MMSGSSEGLADNSFVGDVNNFFLEYVFGFILNDIRAAIHGRANYLAALGLVAYTEFMGGLVSGTLGSKGESRARFNAFASRMGGAYEAAINDPKVDVTDVYEVRCSLAHSYFISKHSVVKASIGDGYGDKSGIEVHDGRVWFIVERYFRDFERAAREYHRALVVDRDPDLLRQFRRAVGNKWFFNAREDQESQP